MQRSTRDKDNSEGEMLGGLASRMGFSPRLSIERETSKVVVVVGVVLD